MMLFLLPKISTLAGYGLVKMLKQFIINRYPERKSIMNLEDLKNDRRRFGTSIIAHIDHGNQL